MLLKNNNPDSYDFSYFVYRYRYSIPPEHGKRLERLAKGNNMCLAGCIQLIISDDQWGLLPLCHYLI